MKPVPKRFAALAIAALAAGTVTACGSSNNGGSTGSSNAGGKPVMGGTLNLVAAGDVDHWDTLSAYYTPTFQLEGAFTRQLVSYLPSNNRTTATTIAADIATTVPTKANGGISANGLTYTFHIKPGVDWNTSPPRPVTSTDFAREFKAMCNPILGVGNSLYYVPVIAGMSTYCTAEAAAFKNNKSPTPAQIAAFQNGHSISGIGTPNSSTITFTLTQPANDFLNILAMPFASARPVEYDSYLPDSPPFRQHLLSDGPYAVTTYVASKKIVLSRNPAWKQSTDPLRHDYVNQIVITEGTTSNETQLADVEAGTDDLMWDTPPPTSAIPSLQASHNPGLHIYTQTGTANPYIVFNLQSPDASKAMSKLLVRQAIEYAINKVAIAKIYGGVTLNPILNGAIAPGDVGYTNYNYYPTPNSEGNPAKCKAMLKQAGYPNGFQILDVYRNAGDHPAVFTSVQASLKACGITSKGVPMQQGPYYAFVENGLNSKKANQWDISEVGWVPDWLGNNGRANVVPLFQTNCSNPTTNDGCYSSKITDADIAKALKAPNQATATPYWAAAGQQVMKDAAIVPLTTQDTVLFTGKRLRNLIYNPLAATYNLTQLWLS
ncbi:MAG TPA: ABC transporter substrate-binding protein [Streptosporangiaceae bacterium]|nr:ABC transporter substrate-binding protein [Streptosporangiaceae bacterium]